VVDTPIAESPSSELRLAPASWACALSPRCSSPTSSPAAMTKRHFAASAATAGAGVPIVIRAPSGGEYTAAHSIRRIRRLSSPTPGSRYRPFHSLRRQGLIKSAIRDRRPCALFEHKALYRRIKEDLPAGEYTVPIGKAAVVRPGKDLSIITYELWSTPAEAANSLQSEGISIEILDLRTLAPLDEAAILETVRKTSKVIVLHKPR